jgi:hypothetical protein
MQGGAGALGGEDPCGLLDVGRFEQCVGDSFSLIWNQQGDYSPDIGDVLK